MQLGVVEAWLRDASDPFTVWLLDRWPEVERVVLPTHSPQTDQRFEDQLRVEAMEGL